jgi:hypothetical protein
MHLEGKRRKYFERFSFQSKFPSRYAMEDNVWIKEAQIFAEKLSEKADSIDFSKFYTAGYDSPMKFWNRRNEVMFLVNPNEV